MTCLAHPTLRLAVVGDADNLVKTINAAFVVEQIAIAGDRIDRAGVETYMRKGRFLLFEQAAAVLACVHIESRASGGYLGLLAVEPSQHGRGFGRRLAEAAEQHLLEQGCRRIDLRVISARAELLPFYQKLGYAVTGTSPMPDTTPLKIPCHFIHLSKELPPAAS